MLARDGDKPAAILGCAGFLTPMAQARGSMTSARLSAMARRSRRRRFAGVLSDRNVEGLVVSMTGRQFDR